MIGDVRDFARRFAVVTRRLPRIPPDNEAQLRLDLITEEYDELATAIENRDIVKVADGIADLIYVLIGTAHSYGIPLEKVWKEVHQTNMAKEGGSTREDGKILKPEGWVPPDIAYLIKREINLQFAHVDVDGCQTLPDGSCRGNEDCMHSTRWFDPEGLEKPHEAILREREEYLRQLGLL
jgi:predicted HAD superfamily Cof-like phosphohydrolase